MESQILKFQVIPSMPVEIDSQKMTKEPSPTQAGKLRLRDKLSGGEGGGQREREKGKVSHTGLKLVRDLQIGVRVRLSNFNPVTCLEPSLLPVADQLKRRL